MILAEVADHAHEIHADHVTTEAEEQRLSETQQPGVAPQHVTLIARIA